MNEDEKNNIENVELSQNTQGQYQPKHESKKKSKKWLIVIAVIVGILVLSFLLFGSCTINISSTEKSNSPSWAFYLYLCGTDLESGGGEATKNVEALKNADLPDNLTVVIEAGGTKEWKNDYFSEDELGIWTITKKEGLVKRDSFPLSSMKEKDTFYDFAKYCQDNYPADNTMLIIWDHGGGPYGGVCGDELFKGDWLMPDGIAEALLSTFGSENSKTNLDIMNFDCCMMGSEEVAYQLKDCADILIASEETEPGGGQNYEEFISAISGNPSITPLEFSKDAIECYGEKYQDSDEGGHLTLSAVDLSKMENVNAKMDAFAGTLIKRLYSNPASIVNIALKTNNVAKYATNCRSTGYANLVDVSDFAKKVGGDSKEAQELIQAVDEAVICQVFGEYSNGSSGLSMYYAIKPDEEQYDAMLDQGTSVGFKAYDQLVQGYELSDDSKEFIRSLNENTDAVPNLNLFKNLSLDKSYPVGRNSEGDRYVDFGPQIGSCSTNVLSTILMKGNNGIDTILGTDDEIKTDWNEGIFVSKFENKWLCAGEYLVSAELAYDSDEYNIYLIPFKFSENDEDKYFLMMLYDFKKEEWVNLGYISDSEQPGAHKTEMIKQGTVIYLINYYYNEDDEWGEKIIGSVNYSDDLIHYNTLPDGEYEINIVVEDAHKDVIISDYSTFTIVNGKTVN